MTNIHEYEDDFTVSAGYGAKGEPSTGFASRLIRETPALTSEDDIDEAPDAEEANESEGRMNDD